MTKQADKPLTQAQLYQCLAGLSEENTLKALQMYKESGLIRDFEEKGDSYDVMMFHAVRRISVRLCRGNNDDAP